jgi:VanZ family protein
VGYAAPLVLSFALSAVLETLQAFFPPRLPSLFDMVCNTAGGGVGALAGRLYAGALRRTFRFGERGLWRAQPAVLMLLCFWVAYQAAPFFPVLGRTALAAKVNAFVSSSLTGTQVFSSLVEWLAVAMLLETVTGPRRARIAVAALLILLPGRLFLLGRPLTLSEAAGASAAVLLWNTAVSRYRRKAAVIACLLLAALVLDGLAPYRITRQQVEFSWVPFRGLLQSSIDWGWTVLFKKSFWYGAVLWSFGQAGFGLARPAVVLVIVLGFIEYLQRRLPGRSPDITDIVMAAIIAAVLFALQRPGAQGVRRMGKSPPKGSPHDEFTSAR